jgi:hypothetical protein
MLEELDHIGTKIARLEQAIEEQMSSYQKVVDAWMTVPGVKQRLAWNLVAEVLAIFGRWHRANRNCDYL